MADLFPIRTVASVTGMNPITLRAWERRYGLITPVRTPSGRRMYTPEHIERVHRIRACLAKGMEISQVARSLDAGTDEGAPSDEWTQYRARMASAVARFDEDALDEAYDAALSVHRLELVTKNVLLPLLADLGRRWESAEASISEEHFFTTYVRNKIGARFHHRARGRTGPKILAACGPGEQHEIGLLLFALAAHDAGMRPVLLGANSPLGELAAASSRASCQAIVISSSAHPTGDSLGDELRVLVTRASVPVCVGGIASTRHHDAITAAGAVPLGIDITAGVRRLAAELARRDRAQTEVES